jgi:hypothetical protein
MSDMSEHIRASIYSRPVSVDISVVILIPGTIGASDSSTREDIN